MKRLLAAVACVVLGSALMAAAAGTVWALDLRSTPNRIISFPANAPALNVGANVTPDSFAMDFNRDASTLYIVTPGAQPFNIGTLNTATGVVTNGPTITGLLTGENITSLKYDPETDQFYLIAFVAATGNRILTLDVNTGVATFVATVTGLPAGGIIIDTGISLSGQMYGHEIAGDSLYTINKNSGAAVLLGPTGHLANFAQGMDFDYETDELYATIYTGGGTGKYVKFDLTDGSGDVIADTTPWNAEMEMAIDSPVPGGCAGDIDGDDRTCQGDLGILLAKFGCCANNPLCWDAQAIAANLVPGDATPVCPPGVEGITQADLGVLLADFNCGAPCP